MPELVRVATRILVGAAVAVAVLAIGYVAYGYAVTPEEQLRVTQSSEPGMQRLQLDEAEVRSQCPSLADALQRAATGETVVLRGKAASKAIAYLDQEFGEEAWQGDSLVELNGTTFHLSQPLA